MDKQRRKDLDALLESLEEWLVYVMAGVPYKNDGRFGLYQSTRIRQVREQLIDSIAASVDPLALLLGERGAYHHGGANSDRNTDQSVTPEYLDWLQDHAKPEGVGGNEAWNAGVAWERSRQQNAAPEYKDDEEFHNTASTAELGAWQRGWNYCSECMDKRSEECSATGQTCVYAPGGPQGELQCRYCGAFPEKTSKAGSEE